MCQLVVYFLPSSLKPYFLDTSSCVKVICGQYNTLSATGCTTDVQRNTNT